MTAAGVRHHWRLGLLILSLLCSSASRAESFEVADHGLLRLPSQVGVVQLDRLTIGASGKLLIPVSITELQVAHLTMKPGAKISIAPHPQPFVLTVRQVDIADGSVIAASGAHGDRGEPGGQGTDLKLTLESGSLANLTVDVRGGDGGQGLAGQAGQSGKSAACWGRGSRDGSSGGDGGDGWPGGNGGRVDLMLGQSQWLEVIDVMLSGGAGGGAGEPGSAGKGGSEARCWLYSLGSAGRDGEPGAPGNPARDGLPGELKVHSI